MTRAARLVVRWRWAVIAAWAVVALVTIPRAARVGDALDATGRPTTVTETQRVRRVVLESFDRPIAHLLFVTVEREAGLDGAAIVDTVAAVLRRAAFVQAVVSPREDTSLVSGDGRAAAIVVTVGADGGAGLTARVPSLRDTLAAIAARTAPDATVRLTGESALEWDARRVAVEDAGRFERAGLWPAAIILVLAFGALAAAVIPIVIGVLAIATALAAIGVASAWTPVAVFALPIVTMVGLGVGIDYSLLLVTRFREEMARGREPPDAAVAAMATAGRAVLVSGAAVAIGFGSLFFTPSSETRSVGLGGLFVVASALALTLTLLPAVLAIGGSRIDWPRTLARHLRRFHISPVWTRWGDTIVRHRWIALAGGLAVIAAASLPLGGLRIGIPRQGWFPAGVESSEAIDVLRGVGIGGAALPVRVVLTAPPGERIVGTRHLRALLRVAREAEASAVVDRVVSPVTLRPGMSSLAYALHYSDLERARARYPELTSAYLSREGETALLDIVPHDTASVRTTMDLVRSLRESVPATVSSDVGVLVGGFAAAQVDEETDLRRALPRMLALVLGASFLALLIAFRSVVVPIKAIVMNGLSVVGALGVVVLVFQMGVGATVFGLDGPTEATFLHVIIVVFAVAFGVSMDYEVFLLSRVKEVYDRTGDTDRATAEGIAATASVITSAAAIMVVVFGAFAFSRMLLAQLVGFGLAAAVLLDATVVRLVTVPALMRVAGKWNWWPGR